MLQLYLNPQFIAIVQNPLIGANGYDFEPINTLISQTLPTLDDNRANALCDFIFTHCIKPEWHQDFIGNMTNPEVLKKLIDRSPAVEFTANNVSRMLFYCRGADEEIKQVLTDGISALSPDRFVQGGNAGFDSSRLSLEDNQNQR